MTVQVDEVALSPSAAASHFIEDDLVKGKAHGEIDGDQLNITFELMLKGATTHRLFRGTWYTLLVFTAGGTVRGEAVLKDIQEACSSSPHDVTAMFGMPGSALQNYDEEEFPEVFR